MKIAIVHDWLTGMRGGERVLERVCALFPEAELHCLLWNRGSVSRAIESHPIHVSSIQRMPLAARHYRWYLPLFPRAIEGLDLGNPDAVLSLSHCVAKGVRVPAGAFHLSYVFTPMRYVWELEAEYFPPGRFPWPLSRYVRDTCASLRTWDTESSRRPDAMIAISRHVAARIVRHYGREAEVIYPPVELDRFSESRSAPSPTAGARDYYLIAGAFAPYKRADIAIAACARLERRVVVVGSGQDEARLRRLAGSGVEFRGWVSDEEMAALYRGARALLFPGEEDFGIVPVEAMASGCPVIAFGRGGAVETVGRGMSSEALEQVAAGGVLLAPGGALFGVQEIDALCEAMRILEGASFERDALRALTAPFAAERFDREIRAAFERHHAAWSARRAGAGSSLAAPAREFANASQRASAER